MNLDLCCHHLLSLEVSCNSKQSIFPPQTSFSVCEQFSSAHSYSAGRELLLRTPTHAMSDTHLSWLMRP